MESSTRSLDEKGSRMKNAKNGQDHVTVEAFPLVENPSKSKEANYQSFEIETRPKKKPRCKGCREWAKCCTDVGHTIRETCQKCDCKAFSKKCCSVKKLKERLPIIKWLPKYRLPHFQGDLIAGLTVGLTVIPQGLAYAVVAELPAQYGLYSAFMGCFMYCVLGTSKDITLGPTAIMSLMTAEFGRSWFHGDATVAIVLTLFCGIIQLLMGLLNIGFLVDFISYPVINSFTTAAAITIAFSQIKTWLGLEGVPRHFMEQVYWTFKKLPETKIWDFVLGLVVMILLIGMKKMKEIKFRDNGQVSVAKKVGRKFIWLLGTARNAIIVILAAGVAAILLHFEIDVFTRNSHIEGGLPSFKPPSFTVTDGNTTYTASDIFGQIGIGFAIVPIIGLIETIAIGKAFARKNNYLIDANQELIAIGISNVLGSFVSSYPVTGSFSRTAVNSQSGVRTPAGGIWTGALVLLALGVLTPLFKYIPDSALAGLIIVAVLDMASFSLIIKLWRIKKIDLLAWFSTFIFSFVLGIEYGIMIGVGVSLLFLMYPWARPLVKVRKDQNAIESIQTAGTSQKEVVVVQLSSGLRFPGIEYVKERVLKEALRDGIAKPVVLDCLHLSSLDFSTTQGLVALFEDFKLHGIPLVLADYKQSVLKTLQSVESPLLRYAATVDEAIASIHEEQEPEDNPRESLISSRQRSAASSRQHLEDHRDDQVIIVHDEDGDEVGDEDEDETDGHEETASLHSKTRPDV